MRSIELLAPAKNLEVGVAAVDHGADAVYIGAPAFGARASAANSIDDIRALIEYAHVFGVKVYVALNTILYDNEIDAALRLAHRLHDIHADALIIQDLGLLECDLPPIPIHASTQLNNATAEKVGFLERVGFSQVVLARELSLRQIHEIAEKTSVALEYFVHGALCVCHNGQCYMSEYATGRSGNRGECAQMCRHRYRLRGLGEEREGFFLSTKDLHLGDRIPELIDAGISSFKIEGRLKDADYVKNVTAFFRARIDEAIAGNPNLRRSSRGEERFSFSPDIHKTFSRGFTSYFIDGRRNADVANIRSPKSQGEYLGKLLDDARNGTTLRIGTSVALQNGDGVCFFDERGELSGRMVNAVHGDAITVNRAVSLPRGADVWRNLSVRFQKQLEQSSHCRKLPVSARFTSEFPRYTLVLSDGEHSAQVSGTAKEKAKNRERAEAMIRTQMAKLGGSVFALREITVEAAELPFLTSAEINGIRRDACEELRRKILASHAVPDSPLRRNDVPFPLSEPRDFRLNIANEKARAFFRRHGVEAEQSAFELEHRTCAPLMTTRYCIRNQLGKCAKGAAAPIFLSDNSHTFRVEFDCERCGMRIFPADGCPAPGIG